jgi:phosphoribosylformylglycinamidine synthase
VVDPTPTVAMVGLIDEEKHITTQWFKNEGDIIILVGPTAGDRAYNLGASRFLKVCFGKKIGPVPKLAIELEIAAQNAVRGLIRLGLVRSAHDCSEGGLAIALAECCFNPTGLLGADVNFETGGASRARRAGDVATTLFNEAQSRIIISCDPKDAERVVSEVTSKNVPHLPLGTVMRDELRISVNGENLSWPIAELHDLWWNAIRRAVESDSEPIPSL